MSKRLSIKKKFSKRKSSKRRPIKRRSIKTKTTKESTKYLNKIIVVNDNEYVIEKKMGSGSYGSVFLVNRNGEKYVIKIILLRPHEYDKENVEKSILKQLQNKCSKYFLCIVESDVKDNTVYIVTKYIPGYIELGDLLKNYKINIDYKIKIAQDLLKGLKDMHNIGIIHRDIKLANILVKPPYRKIQDGSYIKYIDYGFSCLSPDENINNIFTESCYNRTVGTLEYFSPELAENWLYLTDKHDKFTFRKLHFDEWKKCDLWALGILLYMLFIMKSPYKLQNMNDEQILDQILYTSVFENPRPFLYLNKVVKLPKSIINILTNLLQINPKYRNIV
jgi:serine/threonine protein kinase